MINFESKRKRTRLAVLTSAAWWRMFEMRAAYAFTREEKVHNAKTTEKPDGGARMDILRGKRTETGFHTAFHRWWTPPLVPEDFRDLVDDRGGRYPCEFTEQAHKLSYQKLTAAYRRPSRGRNGGARGPDSPRGGRQERDSTAHPSSPVAFTEWIVVGLTQHIYELQRAPTTWPHCFKLNRVHSSLVLGLFGIKRETVWLSIVHCLWFFFFVVVVQIFHFLEYNSQNLIYCVIVFLGTLHKHIVEVIIILKYPRPSYIFLKCPFTRIFKWVSQLYLISTLLHINELVVKGLHKVQE